MSVQPSSMNTHTPQKAWWMAGGRATTPFPLYLPTFYHHQIPPVVRRWLPPCVPPPSSITGARYSHEATPLDIRCRRQSNQFQSAPSPPPSRTDLCRPVVLIQIGCVLTSPTAVKFPSVSACGRARKRTRNIKPRTSLRSVRSVWKLRADHPSRKDALPPPISKSVHRLQQDRMAFASHHCPSSSSSSRGLTETFI